jgi:crotonobetainyl-CoA:carnitine CoA-transferase CaiB-like acyl-CoA transferase
MGRPELATDPRFCDAAARKENRAACIAELDAIFAVRPADEWCSLLGQQRGVWALVQSPREVAHDPQVLANRYVESLDLGDRGAMKVAMPPVQFNGSHPTPRPAPELGADTDRLLLEAGFDWDELIELKTADAIN